MSQLFISQKEKLVIQEFKDKIRQKLSAKHPYFLLFGSKVRGDFTAAYDIDLLIALDDLSQKDKNFISDLATQLYLKHQIDISPHIYSKKEFQYFNQLQTPFSLTLQKEAVKL